VVLVVINIEKIHVSKETVKSMTTLTCYIIVFLVSFLSIKNNWLCKLTLII